MSDPNIRVNILTPTSTRAGDRAGGTDGRTNDRRVGPIADNNQPRQYFSSVRPWYRDRLQDDILTQILRLSTYEFPTSQTSLSFGSSTSVPFGTTITFDLPIFNPSNADIEAILQRSMQDTELKRHPEVELDISFTHSRSTDLDKECTICGNKYKLAEKISTLPECSHCFHHHCISEWGKYKPECPLCRRPIPVLER